MFNMSEEKCENHPNNKLDLENPNTACNECFTIAIKKIKKNYDKEITN